MSTFTSTTVADTERDPFDCSPVEYEIWSIIHIIVIIPILFITIFFTYKFIKHHYADNQRNNNLFYFCTVFFCLITILFFINYIMLDITCYTKAPTSDRVIPIYMAYIFYYVQLYLLLLIFYLKVNHMFEDTKFQLTNCTKKLFVVFFIGTFTLILGTFITGIFSPVLSAILGILSIIGVLILIASLIKLFTNKLSAVYNEDNSQIVGLITKTTILISVSIIITILDIIIAILFITSDSQVHYIDGIYIFVSLFDVLTNFFCVILSFQSFNGYYDKLCACMHIQCVICWSQCMKKADQQQFVGNEQFGLNKDQDQLVNAAVHTEQPDDNL